MTLNDWMKVHIFKWNRFYLLDRILWYIFNLGLPDEKFEKGVNNISVLKEAEVEETGVVHVVRPLINQCLMMQHWYMCRLTERFILLVCARLLHATEADLEMRGWWCGNLRALIQGQEKGPNPTLALTVFGNVRPRMQMMQRERKVWKWCIFLQIEEEPTPHNKRETKYV